MIKKSIFFVLWFFLFVSAGTGENRIVVTSNSSNKIYIGAAKKINVAIVNFTNSITVTNTNISSYIKAKLVKPDGSWIISTIDILNGTGNIEYSFYPTGVFSIIFYDDRDVSPENRFKSTNMQVEVVTPDSKYAGKIFINEIMYDTSIQNEQRWIEIYTLTNINLTNFYFLRGTSSKRYGYRLSDSSALINKNIYTVITPSKDYFERYYPFVTEGTGEYKSGSVIEGKSGTPGFSLNYKFGDITTGTSSSFLTTTGGYVMLVASDGKLVDFAVYDHSYGGSDDISQEKIDVYSSSADENNWGSSVDYHGCTPGKINSLSSGISTSADYSENSIFISKNPFNPAEGAVKIFCKIDKNADVEIDLYDINGRFLFTLKRENNVVKDTELSYIFTGRKPDGSSLLPGMYIVYLKITDKDTGEIYKHGKILVIGTELK